MTAPPIPGRSVYHVLRGRASAMYQRVPFEQLVPAGRRGRLAPRTTRRLPRPAPSQHPHPPAARRGPLRGRPWCRPPRVRPRARLLQHRLARSGSRARARARPGTCPFSAAAGPRQSSPHSKRRSPRRARRVRRYPRPSGPAPAGPGRVPRHARRLAQSCLTQRNQPAAVTGPVAVTCPRPETGPDGPRQ